MIFIYESQYTYILSLYFFFSISPNKIKQWNIVYIPDSLEPNIFNDKAHIQVGGKNIMKVANDVSEVKSFVEVWISCF